MPDVDVFGAFCHLLVLVLIPNEEKAFVHTLQNSHYDYRVAKWMRPHAQCQTTLRPGTLSSPGVFVPVGKAEAGIANPGQLTTTSRTEVSFVPVLGHDCKRRALNRRSASQFVAFGAVYEQGTPLFGAVNTDCLFDSGRRGHPRATSTAPCTRSCLKMLQISGSKTFSISTCFLRALPEIFRENSEKFMPLLCASCAYALAYPKPIQWINYAWLPFVTEMQPSARTTAIWRYTPRS
jgi:hypothetical protein